MTVLLTEVVAIAACQGKMLVVKAGSQLLPQQGQMRLLFIG